ncbi:hypothetical protein [Burkholderia pseudomallei]|uniref:hypothetical protein n=1 Tax=Burkholderia pseudomallei TaxID=28450 RepID=UPI003F688F92
MLVDRADLVHEVRTIDEHGRRAFARRAPRRASAAAPVTIVTLPLKRPGAGAYIHLTLPTV